MNLTRKSHWLNANTLLNISVLCCCVASILLMVLDQRTNKLMQLKSIGNTIVYPLHWIAQTPTSISQRLMTQFQSYESLLEENHALHQRQRLLQVSLQKMIALEAENQRLRTLLKASSDVKTNSLVAEILSIDLDPYRNFVVLNRGSRDHVKIGQPLIDAKGIVGQIVETGLFSSRAILITDPTHMIPVQVVRNGVRGIATGTGKLNELNIINIPMHDNIAEDIRQGDLLISSGLDQRFPAGYPLAIVQSVEYDATRPFPKIVAQPVAALNRIREVLILTPSNAKKIENNQ